MIWVAVIVIAAILEGMSAQLISIWFVGGGIAGMIAQLCGAPVWLQVLIAAVVTLSITLRRMDAWKCSATTGRHAAQKMSVFKKAQRCRWCALRA